MRNKRGEKCDRDPRACMASILTGASMRSDRSYAQLNSDRMIRSRAVESRRATEMVEMSMFDFDLPVYKHTYCDEKRYSSTSN